MHSGRGVPAASNPVPFNTAFRVWLKIGLLNFGGPAGQIAMMHRILVEERRWISEERFLHALNYCMLLPGPEAQQLAVYTGWLLHRIKGGLVAGILFVLPGALVMLLLSILYATYQDLSVVQALFFGIKAAVLAVVVEAVLRIGKRALHGPFMVFVAVVSFLAIFLFDISFPLIVLGAGIVGFFAYKFRPDSFRGLRQGSRLTADVSPADAAIDLSLDHTQPSLGRAIKIAAVCLALWLLPIVLLYSWLGAPNVYVQEGIFFSKMAVVTFGGAYAVLAYVAQQAVDNFGWLEPGEMLDGLGLAETTPGPLIMVLQFVGFLAAYRNPGSLDPLVAGTLGAMVTTWVTFVPCFLWIFVGAPYVESVRGNRALASALATITAAVVGVILNLAVWFAVHVLFSRVNEVHKFGAVLRWPDFTSLDSVALAIMIGALIAMLRFKVSMLLTLALSTLIGAVYQLL
jgi:chromate transporter